jgi:lipopolysaccharide export system permease protein
MLVKNYLLKKIFRSIFAVMFTTGLIFCAVQLSDIMKDAVDGSLPIAYVGKIFIAFVPFIFLLLLPLSILIGGITSFNNLIENGEFIAIKSFGFSLRRLNFWLLNIAIFLCVIAVALSFYIEPIATSYRNKLTEKSDSIDAISGFNSGQFYPVFDGDGVVYIGDVVKEGKKFKNIFFASKEYDESTNKKYWAIMTSKEAKNTNNKNFAHSWIFDNAKSYKFIHGGKSGYELTAKKMNIKLVESTDAKSPYNFDEMIFTSLWAFKKHKIAASVISWRIGVPISIIILMLFVIPISTNNFFSGVFLKVFSGITLFSLYLSSILQCRYYIKTGTLSLLTGVIVTPVIFLSILLIYYLYEFTSKSYDHQRL